jgi:hypothetical protein
MSAATMRVGRMVVRRLILDARAAGYSFNVNNGGDTNELPEPTANVRRIMESLFATDEEHLLLYRDGKRVGWVQLVHCNSGWDVISDYTTNLEAVMSGASALADRYSV